MANQGKVNLVRLLLILFLSLGCITAFLVLFGNPVGAAHDIDWCFEQFDFFNGDYDLLANCLDFAAAKAPDDLKTENTSYEPPPEPTPTLGAIEKQSPPNLNGDPEIYNTECQPDSQLRIVFEFPNAFAGEVTHVNEYVLYVDQEMYELSSSSNGNKLVFVGPAPEQSNPNIQLADIVTGTNPLIRFGDYFIEVCGESGSLGNSDGEPIIYSSTCLQGKQLMVVFEFPEPVTGLYAAQLDGKDYKYAPVTDYPNRAYFFGPPPENQGPASVSLSTIPDGTVVFEQLDYAFPACGLQKPKKDDGPGHYVPPSY
jgi:hypothetical protein